MSPRVGNKPLNVRVFQVLLVIYSSLCFNMKRNCSNPDRGLKSSSPMCLNLSRPAPHLFRLSFFSCQSSCHLFSSILKQWNYFSLFLWVGVSVLVWKANTSAKCVYDVWLQRVWVTLKRAGAEGLFFASAALFNAAYKHDAGDSDRSCMLFWSYLILLISSFLSVQHQVTEFKESLHLKLVSDKKHSYFLQI